jgi:hypothetical protein
MNEDVRKMSHNRLKFHMNTGVPHGSHTKDEMKAERDRRMKYKDSADAYKKAKSSMYEEVELDEAETKYVIKHKKNKQVLNTHDDYATAKDEHEGLGADKKNYGVYKQTKKDAALRNRNTYREEVALDEGAKTHFVYQRDAGKTKEVVHRGTEQSSKDWIEKNAKFFGHKGKNFDIYKGKYPNVKPSDKVDYRHVAESVELDEISKNTLGRYASKALNRGDMANRMSKSDEKLAPHIVRGDNYIGVPDRVVAQAKDKVKKMNLRRASEHEKAMNKALSDLGWELTVGGKYVRE